MTNLRLYSLKKRTFVAGVLIVLLALSLWPTAVYAAPVRDGIDAILVIDTSGSMRTSDVERTALEAAQLFIDMLDTRNSRVGIISFTNELGAVVPLTPVNTPAEREELRNTIGALEYGGWTDIGLALRAAAEMVLTHGDPSNSPMVILFTDGDINLGPNQAERTDQMSYEDTWWAVDIMEDHGPIYTIGLNYHGDVNVNFLRTISDRTLARSFIVDVAAGLPLIFSEIFASHIRSSITEIAEIIAEGDAYADVLIPIPSAFVAEANIIMLSEHPLVNVRLTDPLGNEAELDGVNHILTYANRYSMIKSINPMVGDWILSVMGLADDRITVNLIYSFDVNISVSVSQENVPGPLYDPTLPVTVQAGFIFADPRIDAADLYAGATAELRIYNSTMQLQHTVPMVNTGAGFTADYMISAAVDLETAHVSVSVNHPDFEVSSAFVTVSYAQPQVEAEPEPTTPPDPTPEPPPAPAPVQEEPAGFPILPVVIVAAIILAVILFVRQKGQQPKVLIFSGYLEVKALLEDGLYTALEAPDLSTFPGRTALYDFLSLSLKNQSERILKTIEIGDIYIQPHIDNGEVVIQLQNRGNCQIQDSSGNTKTETTFSWHNNERLIFVSDGKSQLEITYRTTED